MARRTDSNVFDFQTALTSSFRGDAKHRIRNLLGSSGMTVCPVSTQAKEFLRFSPVPVRGNRVAATRTPKMEQAMDPLPTANSEITQFNRGVPQTSRANRPVMAREITF
jgi:hypothetical protein